MLVTPYHRKWGFWFANFLIVFLYKISYDILFNLYTHRPFMYIFMLVNHIYHLKVLDICKFITGEINK